MMAAVLAAAAVWCVISAPAASRFRAVFGSSRPSRSVSPPGITAALVPLACLVFLGLPTGLFVGLVAAPLAHRAVGQLESAASRRHAARIAAQLPGALDLMVAVLEVGRPPVMAFALVAEATADPLGAELATVASRLALAGDSMAVWKTVEQDRTLAPIGRAFRRAEASGMPVAQVVTGVADELRRDRRAQRRDHSQKVAVKTAAPLGACFLPAFFLVGIVPTVIATFSTFTF